MSTSLRRHASPGFSLFELMVVISIIGVMMALTLPSIGTSARLAKQRTVPERFLQDFAWARGAARVADATVLNDATVTGLSGLPTVQIVFAADCSWTTSVTTPVNAITTVPSHSMTTAQLAALGASAMTCAGAGTYVFTTLGFVSPTNQLTFTGSDRAWVMNVLSSGSIVRFINGVTS